MNYSKIAIIKFGVMWQGSKGVAGKYRCVRQGRYQRLFYPGPVK